MKISEFLRTLTVEQEDRVLTGKMLPGYWATRDGGGCLMGNVYGVVAVSDEDSFHMRFPSREIEQFARWFNGRHEIGQAYFLLCQRFGLDVANNAIRNRILRNRLQRSLAPVSGKPSVAELSAVSGAP